MPHPIGRGATGKTVSNLGSLRRDDLTCWAEKIHGRFWGKERVGLMGVEKQTGAILGSRNKLWKAGKQDNAWCLGESLEVQSKKCPVCLCRSQSKKLGLNSEFNRKPQGVSVAQ